MFEKALNTKPRYTSDYTVRFRCLLLSRFIHGIFQWNNLGNFARLLTSAFRIQKKLFTRSWGFENTYLMQVSITTFKVGRKVKVLFSLGKAKVFHADYLRLKLKQNSFSNHLNCNCA